ncbi:gamma-glutamyltranspeptidase [Catenaria anguillulae PL171]|uniref:Glutathione hydrolase n=1 Tax=Catenaria anguillulae PL171 TaxID=765915 RepID=A0A1Y2HN29_9FUNG|nr:gamma-glutamyltranspeptidase [Catenaria anguillulae PL171]
MSRPAYYTPSKLDSFGDNHLDLERGRPLHPSRSHAQKVRRAVFVAGFVALLLLSTITLKSAFQSPHSTNATTNNAQRIQGPKLYKHAAVSSEVPVCSTIGKKLLKAGGSAVDAAIGTSLCVGSINSFASGIGGGGFMLIRNVSGHSLVIDFREVAPAAISESMFKSNPLKSQIGGLAVGVPGELRGYELAHRKFGKLPWARILEPIVALNADGFQVPSALAARLKYNEEWIMASPIWRAVFAPQGQLVSQGALVKRPAYARTLRDVAHRGAQAFYTGSIARSLVDAIRGEGGVMSMRDLAGYRVEERKPVESSYKGNKVISVGAPASGHVLLHMLNIMEGYEFSKDGAAAVDYHRMVEAMRYGFARRSELGDPAFLKIDGRLDQILSKDEAAAARRNLSDSTTYPPEHYQPKYANAPSHGTTHLSVVDENGMAVAVTTTVNLLFGSHIMDKKTGVILNNQIDDFSFNNTSNAFGFPPSPSNFIKPFKRPMSSMSPTMVEKDGRVMLVLGGSGGSRIISSVFQTILKLLEFNWSITESVTAPRLHDQLYPDRTDVEDGFSAAISSDLAAKKHKLRFLPVGQYESVVQAIARTDKGEW